jgi:hypothetical protein
MMETPPKHPGAVSLGKRRMELLTPEQRQELTSKAGKARLKKIPRKLRQEIAKKAAQARWGAKKK